MQHVSRNMRSVVSMCVCLIFVVRNSFGFCLDYVLNFHHRYGSVFIVVFHWNGVRLCVKCRQSKIIELSATTSFWLFIVRMRCWVADKTICVSMSFYQRERARWKVLVGQIHFDEPSIIIGIMENALSFSKILGSYSIVSFVICDSNNSAWKFTL